MSVLSRRTNLITGEKYMTEQNALRHYISKAKKSKCRNNFEEMWELYSQATKILHVDYCYKCHYEDFGYCGLRKSYTSEEEKFIKHCFDGFIKEMEDMLNEMQSKNACPF